MSNSAPQRSLLDRTLDVVDRGYTRFETWLFTDKHALHGAAFARILSGCSVLGILITNFRPRNLLFGQGSVWNAPLQNGGNKAAPDYFVTNITENMSNSVFLVYYLAVIALAVAWVLGWHTKLVGPLMLIGETSIIERIPILGDQGDNILRVGLILLMFMQVNEVWSLDARRRAVTVRTGNPLTDLWNSHRVLPTWFTNATHNVAFAALAFQIMILYFMAGFAKTGGALWQHGTALYYPLQLQEYKPFPLLTDLLTEFGIVIGIATYITILVQLGFAFALLHPVARRFAIIMILLFHLGIAVMMALPWFSLSMVAFDAIFVSSATYVALQGWFARKLLPVTDWFWDVSERFRGSPKGGARRA